MQTQFDSLLSNCKDEQSRVCLLAASSKESGAWLHAMPLSLLGLRMSNETIGIAVCFRPGTFVYQPHWFISSSIVMSTILVHMASAVGIVRVDLGHNNLNEIIHHCFWQTMTPWSHGQSPVWDVTCTDTLCTSNLHRSVSEPEAASSYAESKHGQICQPCSNIPFCASGCRDLWNI